jgi:hypothetical protein
VNTIKRLFGLKRDWLDVGFAKLRVVSSSNYEDVIVLKGIEKSLDGAVKARLVEQGFIATQKCQCGGEWRRTGSSSAYPRSYQYCCCAGCGLEKKFEFVLKN